MILSKENCWFFCSVIQEHLSSHHGGYFVRGALCHPKIAGDTRARILKILRDVSDNERVAPSITRKSSDPKSPSQSSQRKTSFSSSVLSSVQIGKRAKLPSSQMQLILALESLQFASDDVSVPGIKTASTSLYYFVSELDVGLQYCIPSLKFYLIQRGPLLDI
jgi:hypothetical protein